MHFRPLQAADFDAWLPLWQAYLQSGHVSQPPALIHHIWNEILARRIQGYGAFSAQNELLGMAHCILHPSTSSERLSCYLEDLFVAEAARRQGVARFLLTALFSHYRAQGCYKLYWITHQDNIAAQNLYHEFAPQIPFVQFKKYL